MTFKWFVYKQSRNPHRDKRSSSRNLLLVSLWPCVALPSPESIQPSQPHRIDN